MSVVSKNLFDLLGNDDGDSDSPAAPVKTVEKTSTHTSKRNTDGVAPASQAHASGGGRRGAGVSGNEAAFRDRNAGSDRNRSKPTDDFPRGGGRGGRGRGGGRGARRGELGDRHPGKHLPGGGSEKQAAQAWGAPEGEAELKDENAGEAMAQTEQNEAIAEGDATEAPKEPEQEEEPEDKHISYADYLAQQAEKKLSLAAEALSVRKPNEGTKEDKKWAAAKPLVKDEGDDYVSGSGGKSKRERERKVKQVVDIDQRFVETDRPRGGRGGRGGAFRGDSGRGRGRGGPRGGGERSDFSSRGDREFSRGGGRGGRGGRGGAPSQAQAINHLDENAFPSLGGK